MSNKPANFKWNYACHALDGTFYSAAMALVATETVLPPIIESLGGPTWMIAIIPQSFLMGFMFTTLFLAHWVEQQKRLKGPVLLFGILQRLPYLIAGLTLWFFGLHHPKLTSYVVGLTPLMSGVYFGLMMTGWSELVSRTIPANRRASNMALRNLSGACLAIAGGFLIKQTLEQFPGPQGYACLHFASFGLMVISFYFVSRIKEQEHTPPTEDEALSFKENIRSLPDILRKDKSFRHYVLSRILGSGMWVGVPYFSLHVLEITERPESYLGLLVSAQMAGSFVGNFAGGAAGDLKGGRLVLIMARACYLSSFSLIALSTTMPSFLVAFFLFGAAISLNIIGHSTLMLELPPQNKRPTYVGLAAFLNAPPMLIAGFVAWGLHSYLDSIAPLIWISCVFVAMSLYHLLQIEEPRLHTAGS